MRFHEDKKCCNDEMVLVRTELDNCFEEEYICVWCSNIILKIRGAAGRSQILGVLSGTESTGPK